MKTVHEFTDQIHAGLLLSVLQDNKIDATLVDENASAWGEARLLAPIRLQVPDQQFERALSLIEEFENAPDINNEGTPLK